MDIQYARHPDAPPGMPPAAARAGDLIFVGGQMAAHPVRGVPDETKLLPGYPWHGSAIEKQLTYLYGNLDATLQKLGSSLRHTLKINSYHTNPPDIDMALRVRKEWFGAQEPPPSTLVLAPELPICGPTVLIDMINLAADARLGRERVKITKTPPIGHVAAFGWAAYLHGVRGGGFVCTQGKVANDQRGPIPEILAHPVFPYRYHQIRVQTEYALATLKDILEDAGCRPEDVVRAEVHLANMADLATLDEIWREFFPKAPPARVVVPLPLAAPSYAVEIEFIAVDPKGPYRKKIIETPEAPRPLGHESQAVMAGPYLFLSGQLATNFKDGMAPEARPNPNFPFHFSPVRLQVDYIYRNVEAICRAAGTSIQNLLKRRVHHLDLKEMAEAEELWQKRLGDRLPPTSTFRVNGPLPVPGCTIQYDLIAFVSS